MPLKLFLRIDCPKDKEPLLLSECVECTQHLGIDYQHMEVACIFGDGPCSFGQPVGNSHVCNSKDTCQYQYRGMSFSNVKFCSKGSVPISRVEREKQIQDKLE